MQRAMHSRRGGRLWGGIGDRLVDLDNPSTFMEGINLQNLLGIRAVCPVVAQVALFSNTLIAILFCIKTKHTSCLFPCITLASLTALYTRSPTTTLIVALVLYLHNAYVYGKYKQGYIYTEPYKPTMPNAMSCSLISHAPHHHPTPPLTPYPQSTHSFSSSQTCHPQPVSASHSYPARPTYRLRSRLHPHPRPYSALDLVRRNLCGYVLAVAELLRGQEVWLAV